MTAAGDNHTAAQAAVGHAEVLDPRCIGERKYLVASIVGALKEQGMRTSVEEAVSVVDWFYDTDAVGNPLTGADFVRALVRKRMSVVRDREVLEHGQMTAREAARWADDKATIQAWPCRDCGAVAGQQCRNGKGEELSAAFPGHPSRIRQAMGLTPRRWSA